MGGSATRAEKMGRVAPKPFSSHKCFAVSHVDLKDLFPSSQFTTGYSSAIHFCSAFNVKQDYFCTLNFVFVALVFLPIT